MVKSALIGHVPAGERDYWIIKGMYRAAYRFHADPNNGYTLMPKKPAGPVSSDKGPEIIAGMVVAIIIMLFFTITRLSLRFFKSGLRSGADDWVLIPGSILAIMYPILQIVMVTHGGGGRHVWDVTYEEYNTFNALGVVCKMIFFTTVGIIKISIALFLRRMSGATSRGWRIANDFLIFLLIGYTLLALFWTCFQCDPPPAMWDKVYSGKLGVPATCWSTKILGNALSIIHVAMDFVILMIPMVILWRVKLSRAKKVRLYLVFSAGALSCIASVFRELAQGNIDRDITYGYTTLLAWTVVDLTLAVVVASLPVLSALLPSVFRQLTGTTRVFETTLPQTMTGNITAASRAATTHRRESGQSDEGGILCEHQIELSYTMDKMGIVSDDRSGASTRTAEPPTSWNRTETIRHGV